MPKLALVLLVGFGCTTAAAPAGTHIDRSIQFTAACPELITAAKATQIAISGIGEPIDSASGTNSLRPGDAMSVLATFVEKKKRTQWLLRVEATPVDPTKPTPKPSKFTVQTSFGPPMEFESRPVPAKLRMLGPFGAEGWKKPPKTESVQAQLMLNEDFLALGMDEAAETVFRWSSQLDFSKPLSSKALKAMNPTPAEQRAVSGAFPALISYFEIVKHTEGLKDLLFKLVELPSVWSMIKHRGVHVDLSFGNGLAPSPAASQDWDLPATMVTFHFPWMVRLNGEPALKMTLVTTRPHPPLLICGGVVGVLLQKIDDDETYLTMRLLSAASTAEQ